MTYIFFAPVAFYAEDWKGLRWNARMDAAAAIGQLKDMVKAFHRKGGPAKYGYGGKICGG